MRNKAIALLTIVCLSASALFSQSLMGPDAEVEELEHDTQQGTYNSLVQVDSDTYLLAYQGLDGDGFIKTFTISADGATVTQVQSLTHDNINGLYNSIVQVDSDTYLLAYTGQDNDGYLKTFTVAADGSTITQVAVLEHDTDSGTYHSLVKVDSDTYVLAYAGNSNDGYIKTFTVPADGSTITQVAVLEHDTNQAIYNSLVQVDTDTYVLGYRDGWSDGQLKTFTIPADGSTITQVATYEYDTVNSTYNSLVKIDSDTYAVTWYGYNSAATLATNSWGSYVKTFTIPADGSSITAVAVLKYGNYSNYHPSWVDMGNGRLALAYAYAGSYGEIRTFYIPLDGSAVTDMHSLYHNTAGTGQHNSLVKVDANTVALAYSGSGSDGYISTFTIHSGLAFQSSLALASDNSTLAVTFDQAVFNTNGGSGALQASDFAFSLSGGATSLSSATPTSISISGNVVTLGIGLSGTPNGSETLTVKPVANSIYDASGNAVLVDQKVAISVTLNDKLAPTITSTADIPVGNATVAVTFSESVYNTNGGSGALQASDFAFAISGGTATLSSATPTSISISSNTYTLGIGLSGTANGSETLTITPVANSIYDAGGNAASTTQSNNTAVLNEGRITVPYNATGGHNSHGGYFNSLLRINPTTFAVAYGRTAGYIKTFTISADGTTYSQKANLVFDQNRGYYNSFIRISSDTYAIAYQGYNYKLGHYGGQLKIVSIPEDGSEVKVLSQWTFDHGSSG